MSPSCLHFGMTAALFSLLVLGPATGSAKSFAPPLTSPEATRLLSPGDPEAAQVQEALRRGLWSGPDPNTAGAAWSTLSEWVGADPAGLPRWWSPSVDADPALSLRPELMVLGRFAEPHLQLRPLHLDVRAGEAVDPAWRSRLGLRADLRLLPEDGLSAHLRFTFDSEGRNDAQNRTRDFSQLNATNDFEEAYVRWAGDRLALLLGRVPLHWGPERLGGLALSHASPAPDLLLGAARWGPHRLEAFVGRLSSENSEPTDPTSPLVRRWLYGHRVDLHFADGRLRLGLGELALLAGPGEGLDLRYVNPVPLWAQVQAEDSGDDPTQANVVGSLDGELRVTNGMRVYGTLLVDDLQIDGDGRRRNPDQLAWSAGMDWTPSAGSPWLVGYEYRRLGSWTWIHRGEGTGYRQHARPIGAPEGPDVDRHDLRLDWRPVGPLLVWGEIERRRRGENRLATDATRQGNGGRPFPLGTVEKSWILGTGVDWSFVTSGAIPLAGKAALEAAFHEFENLNNEAGADERIWVVRLALTLRFGAIAYRP